MAWPALPTDLESYARDSDFLLNDEDMSRAAMLFELQDNDTWPKAAFSTGASGMEPRKYWEYLTKILLGRRPSDDPTRRFCDLMAVLVLIPCSNAAVERNFSQAALEQTKLRNRLTPEKIKMLLRVSKPEIMLSDDSESDD